MLNIYVSSDYNTWADENEREKYSLSLYNVPENFIWLLDKFLKEEAERELKKDHVQKARELLNVLNDLREGYCKAHEQIKELKKEYEVSQAESEE